VSVPGSALELRRLVCKCLGARDRPPKVLYCCWCGGKIKLYAGLPKGDVIKLDMVANSYIEQLYRGPLGSF
jgi:hypothetical protein